MGSPTERLARVARRQTLSLTHYGRRSGTPYHVTIWFVVEGDVIWLASLDVRRQWTRNVRARPDVSLTIGDETFAGRVTPIGDPAAATRVIDLIGAKYWFAKPMIWLDRWLGRAGLGPHGGAFRVDVR